VARARQHGRVRGALRAFRPESSLVKLRNFAERVVDHIYIKLKLVRAPQSNFLDLLNNGSFRMVATDLVLDKLHLLRKLGNRAAHGEGVQAKTPCAVSARLGNSPVGSM
jgi:hypothetical protein